MSGITTRRRHEHRIVLRRRGAASRPSEDCHVHDRGHGREAYASRESRANRPSRDCRRCSPIFWSVPALGAAMPMLGSAGIRRDWRRGHEVAAWFGFVAFGALVLIILVHDPTTRLCQRMASSMDDCVRVCSSSLVSSIRPRRLMKPAACSAALCGRASCSSPSGPSASVSLGRPRNVIWPHIVHISDLSGSVRRGGLVRAGLAAADYSSRRCSARRWSWRWHPSLPLRARSMRVTAQQNRSRADAAGNHRCSSHAAGVARCKRQGSVEGRHLLVSVARRPVRPCAVGMLLAFFGRGSLNCLSRGCGRVAPPGSRRRCSRVGA